MKKNEKVVKQMRNEEVAKGRIIGLAGPRLNTRESFVLNTIFSVGTLDVVVFVSRGRFITNGQSIK